MSSLLPSNGTGLERALSDIGSRIDGLPVRIRDVWNPRTCPVELLPWLAWAFSVDSWDRNWSEEQKRGAVESSIYVHQHKGTAGAMKKALSALGYSTELREWFQLEPKGQPYTFGLYVTIEQTGIPTGQQWDYLESVAESAKNVRSHLTGVHVKGKTNAAIYCGAAVISGERIHLAGEA